MNRESSIHIDIPGQPPHETIRHHRMPTPVNSLGLVVTETLITLIRQTVDPHRGWDSDERPDRHHTYWPRRSYPDIPEASVNPAKFRELPSNIVIVPRLFHTSIHTYTEAPPIPSLEVMHEQLEADAVTKELYRNARHARKLDRNRWISEEKLKRGKDYHLEQSYQLPERARRIPKEFQLMDFSIFNPTTFEEVQASAQQLGRIAINPTNLVRHIRQYTLDHYSL